MFDEDRIEARVKELINNLAVPYERMARINQFYGILEYMNESDQNSLANMMTTAADQTAPPMEQSIMTQNIEDEDPFATINLDPQLLQIFSSEKQKYKLDDIQSIKIKEGTEVGANFLDIGLGKPSTKYIIGKELCAGGFGAVYIAQNDPEKVIKIERVGIRSPRDFFQEIFVQNQAAKSGFTAAVEAAEIAEYERHIFGEETPGKCWFYVIVMKRLPMSLKD